MQRSRMGHHKSCHFNINTKKKNKENFEPEFTELKLSLRESYAELNKHQRDVAVAITKLLPKDINLINDIQWKHSKLCPLNTDERLICNNLLEVNKLLTKLAESKASRIVAVHRTITNKGSKSPGISNDSLPTTNKQYVILVNWLRYNMRHPNRYQTSPLDRVYIPKKKDVKIKHYPSKLSNDVFKEDKNLRPISIPSIKDRCLQAAYLNAYQVVSEYFADPHSYAFRPGRSPAWAAHSIAAMLRGPFQATWALEIDISKCFDNICHDFISKTSIGIPKEILNKWLKQGYILRNHDYLGKQPTEKGIPQGGVISPSICNMTLDGLTLVIEKELKKLRAVGRINKSNAGYVRLTSTSKLFKLFRFADDIVVLTRSRYIALLVQEIIKNFLDTRGLQLSLEKTKLTDLSGGRAYFKFVGYGFLKRTYWHNSKWYIVPPPENIKSIKNKLRLISRNKSSIAELFYKYNVSLQSWINYYMTTNCSKHLNDLNSWVFINFYFALERRIRKAKQQFFIKHLEKSKIKYNKKRHHFSRRVIYKIINSKYRTYIPYRNSKIKWYVIKNHTKFRNSVYILYCPKVTRLIRNFPLTACNLNYFLDDVKIFDININYSYGVRHRVYKKNLKKYGKLSCEGCRNTVLNKASLVLHHVLPVSYGGKSTDTNLKIVCTECHKLIHTSVASRDLDNCLLYINEKLLKIPDNVFKMLFSNVNCL